MPSDRILLITYHFGADGATGGFRWRAMAEHLASRGWRVDVVAAPSATPMHGDDRYPAALGDLIEVATPAWGRWPTRAIAWLRARRHSPALRESAPPTGAPSGTPAETASTVDPAAVTLWTPPSARSRLNRILLLVEGVATLIAEWSWARAAARAARANARRTSPAVLVVSTPPHLSSLAAVRMARALGLPSVVDFRDPWVLGFEESMRFNDDDVQLAIWRRAELRVLREASVIVHNTDRALRVVTDALGTRRRAVHVAVPNGYEDGPPAAAPDRAVFRVSFTGWLHPVMDVRVLLSALGRLRARQHLTPADFDVCFMGTAPEFGGVSLEGLAASYGLADVFSLRPRGTRAEALRMQQSSAVLCAIDYRHPMAVPMKFYDYAQMCGTMLLVGERPSALADAAARIGLPVFTGDDDQAIDAFLDAALARWREGRMDRPMDAERVFSRARQSARMDEVLRETVAAHR
jgi:hypothetical protein